MIPINPISKEQAEKLGLTKPTDDPKGEGAAAAMVVMKKNKNKPDELMEKYIIKKNGKKELIFMHNHRKANLKLRGNFSKYLEQFESNNIKKKLQEQ